MSLQMVLHKLGLAENSTYGYKDTESPLWNLSIVTLELNCRIIIFV